MPMSRNAAATLCAAMLVWSAAPVGRAQAGKTYQARLSPMPVDGPPMMATIAGGGSVTAVLTGNKLTITGTFTGLKSPATGVKIHRGIKGVRGPAVLDLPHARERAGRTDRRHRRSHAVAGRRSRSRAVVPAAQ